LKTQRAVLLYCWRGNLTGTGVTDVTPLAGLSALRWLELGGTGVTDVSPLAALPNLEIIFDGATIRPAALKINKRRRAPKPS
jgi:hypothetical protein